jgi:hypothetical protein
MQLDPQTNTAGRTSMKSSSTGNNITQLQAYGYYCNLLGIDHHYLYLLYIKHAAVHEQPRVHKQRPNFCSCKRKHIHGFKGSWSTHAIVDQAFQVELLPNHSHSPMPPPIQPISHRWPHDSQLEILLLSSPQPAAQLPQYSNSLPSFCT